MKKKVILLAAVEILLLAGCGAAASQGTGGGADEAKIASNSADEETVTEGTNAEDGDDSAEEYEIKELQNNPYIWQEITITLPDDWIERCVVDESESGFSIYQKASYERDDTSGYICGLFRTQEPVEYDHGKLLIARNEIYARHGRQFANGYVQQYFDRCTWYEGKIPPQEFQESSLNQTEKDNLRLLAAAEEEYDGSRIVDLGTGWYDFLPSFGHVLYEELPVYCEWDETSATTVIPAQEEVFFLGTDGERWILVKGKDGSQGYMLLDNNKIMELNKPVEEVFGGLHFSG